MKTTNDFKVDYKEYANYEDVRNVFVGQMEKREGIKGNIGFEVETLIGNILKHDNRILVEDVTDKMDILFGADYKVLYQRGNTVYSFYIDVTTAQKDATRYFSHEAGITTDWKEKGKKHSTEYFDLYYGMKKRHNCIFKYDKPVMVLHVDNYEPTMGVAFKHIHKIVDDLINLHDMFVELELPIHASREIYPNVDKFPAEFTAHLNKPKSYNGGTK
jgi:hypothetical protein